MKSKSAYNLFKRRCGVQQKRFQLLGFGIVEDFVGRAVFGDFAVRHKHDAVGNLSCKVHFVRYDNHCTVAFKPLYDFQDFARKFGIERGRRLVKAQDIGGERKGSCDCDALLLSARKFARICRASVQKPDL